MNIQQPRSRPERWMTPTPPSKTYLAHTCTSLVRDPRLRLSSIHLILPHHSWIPGARRLPVHLIRPSRIVRSHPTTRELQLGFAQGTDPPRNDARRHSRRHHSANLLPHSDQDPTLWLKFWSRVARCPKPIRGSGPTPVPRQLEHLGTGARC